jgi:hypothetical protein
MASSFWFSNVSAKFQFLITITPFNIFLVISSLVMMLLTEAWGILRLWADGTASSYGELKTDRLTVWCLGRANSPSVTGLRCYKLQHRTSELGEFFVTTKFVNSSILDVPGGKVTIFWEVTVSVILSKKAYMYVSYSERFPSRAISLYSTLYRRATHHVLTHVAKYIDVDGIFENVLLGKLYQLCHLNNKYQY